MEILDLLTSDSVLTCVRASSKKQVLHELAKQAAELTGLHERKIFDVLLERER
ncbi:MAG: transcriptional regulator, partial [Rhodospirillaceae bacterium]|nr:transcriptional regulator [Rhodospirillaceae bacterium]